MRTIAARRSSRSRLALACLLSFVACNDPRGPAVVVGPAGTPLPAVPAAPRGPTSLDVRPGVLRLALGGTATLTATASDLTGATVSDVAIGWRSSDTNVVSVDTKSGAVIARAIGGATITATLTGTSSGLWANAKIVVEKKDPFDIVFSSLSTVGNYACGVEAVTSLAYCWGDNHSGALGIGSAEWMESPMLVGYGMKRFRNLSLSAYWNCAIEVDTDLPFCWGGTHDLLPTGSWPGEVNAPSLVGAGRFRFSSLSAGTLVTCGIERETSRAYCWGHAELIGDGARIQQATPTPVGGPGSDLRFATISASPEVVCGIEAVTAHAYCWGRNRNGQIGDGTSTDRLIPTLVANGAIRFSAISAGESVVCGIEAQSARALCWGANSLGQLGDGSVTSRLLPTPVAGAGLRFSSIEAGPNMVCAIEAATEAAYCWGRNSYGSLGDGTRLNRLVPTLVAGAIRFASISTGGGGGGYGGNETCGVEARTGRAFCWGFDRLVPTLFESTPSWPK